MANQHTVTKTEIQSIKVEWLVAFGHVPGVSKWLHFTYDIGRKRLEYRLRSMRSKEGEFVSFFDSLDDAIVAYNDIS